MVFIGEKLRYVQEQLKKTQDEFSNDLNIAQGTLSKYIRNVSPAPMEIGIIIYKRYNRDDVAREWMTKMQEKWLHDLLN